MTERAVSPVLANSRVARAVAAAARGSVAWRLVRRPVRRAVALWHDAGLIDAASAAQPVREDVGVPPVVTGSLVLKPALSAGTRLLRAVDTSATVHWIRATRTSARALPVAATMRLVGVTLLCAIATHGLALVLMPARLRPTLPWPLGVFAVAVALTITLVPDGVARAWIRWRDR